MGGRDDLQIHHCSWPPATTSARPLRPPSSAPAGKSPRKAARPQRGRSVALFHPVVESVIGRESGAIYLSETAGNGLMTLWPRGLTLEDAGVSDDFRRSPRNLRPEFELGSDPKSDSRLTKPWGRSNS